MRKPENGKSSDSPSLSLVRRLEAVSFRSFPSTTTYYDGTWAIRLTAGHPANRLNSVNPLDPEDHREMEKRLELARLRFRSYDRPLVLRQTPLAPKPLIALMDQEGWRRFDETLVMTAPIEKKRLADAVDRVPLRDVGRWVDRHLELAGQPIERKPGMVEVISSIQAEYGLFLSQSLEEEALATVRCVCDGELAGIFELETNPAYRRRGHGSSVLESALKWAAALGARRAWLQVVADNHGAVALYRRYGFVPVYRYVYRSLPQ